jgi:transketolase
MREVSEGIITRLENKAIDIRKKIIDLTVIAGGGHIGGALSMTDIVVALYYHAMKYDPKQRYWPDRDRFVLSKGHGAIGICPILADVGFYPEEQMSNFNGLDSPFGMHPDMNKIPGIEMSTGSLGHGLSIALGIALAGKMEGAKWRVFCMTGDGELDEGMIWEAAMAAHHFKLSNLVAIVDRNGLSLDGPTEEVMALEPLEDKWKAFGWNCMTIDGHSMKELVVVLDSISPANSDKPTCIIAKTVKGKGVPFMENVTDWHYGGLDDAKAEEIKNGFEKIRKGGR